MKTSTQTNASNVIILDNKSSVDGPVNWWVCDEGHVFSHGDKSWHSEASYSDGTPKFCWGYFEENDPCMSNVLIAGPFTNEATAERNQNTN